VAAAFVSGDGVITQGVGIAAKVGGFGADDERCVFLGGVGAETSEGEGLLLGGIDDDGEGCIDRRGGDGRVNNGVRERGGQGCTSGGRFVSGSTGAGFSIAIFSVAVAAGTSGDLSCATCRRVQMVYISTPTVNRKVAAIIR